MAVTHLQHVQQGRLSGIIETEEQQLGVLVEKAEGGENVVDYTVVSRNVSLCFPASYLSCHATLVEGCAREHTPVDNPHLACIGVCI